MDRGELSKVCQAAVILWGNKSNDRTLIIEQEAILKEEKEELDKKYELILEKKKEADIIYQEDMKEKEEIRKKMYEICKVYNDPEEWIEEQLEYYWINRKTEDGTLSQYLSRKRSPLVR
jgi:site-specific DNA-adenine methylase